MDLAGQQQIKEEAERLLEKFSKQLSCIESGEENNVERENDRRKDETGKICDITFKKIMFENALAKDSEFIIAETKKW